MYPSSEGSSKTICNKQVNVSQDHKRKTDQCRGLETPNLNEQLYKHRVHEMTWCHQTGSVQIKSIER